MCIFSHFQYLCSHEKLKIARPCHKAVKDSHGVLTCPDAPNPNAIDGTHHTFGDRAYGVGVCSSIHCAWYYGILPVGDYGDDERFGNSASFEDDTEIDDSPAAREDRVGRWFRHLLDADQQLEHFKTEYPVPYGERSTAGKALLSFPHGAGIIIEVFLDGLQWQELNPLYLTPAMLQYCVHHRLLPASIVDGRRDKKISPLKPAFGPFKHKAAHTCSKKRGICKICGKNVGDRELKEATLSHRQEMAMLAMVDEDLAKNESKGAVWDPSVALKWDDHRGKYCKIPVSSDFNIYDAPYPISSGPAFVPPVAQAVNSAAVFDGQDGSLADNSTHASTGMDWDRFLVDAAIDVDWLNREFPGDGELAMFQAADADMNDIQVNDQLSADAYLDTTLDGQNLIDFGLANSKLDTNLGFQENIDFTPTGPQSNTHPRSSNAVTSPPFNDTSISFNNANNHDTLLQDTDSFDLFTSTNHISTHDLLFPNPGQRSQTTDDTVISDLASDPMITCDTPEKKITFTYPANSFFAEPLVVHQAL